MRSAKIVTQTLGGVEQGRESSWLRQSHIEFSIVPLPDYPREEMESVIEFAAVALRVVVSANTNGRDFFEALRDKLLKLQMSEACLTIRNSLTSKLDEG